MRTMNGKATPHRINQAREIASLLNARDEIDARINRVFRTATPIGPGKRSLEFARSLKGLNQKDRAALRSLKREAGIDRAMKEAEAIRSKSASN